MVENLKKFLHGNWDFVRQIDDKYGASSGEMKGHAEISPEGDHYLYQEEGTLETTAYQGSFHRSYIYKFDGEDVVKLYFLDGKFFHDLILKKEGWDVEHVCGEDRYVGHFEQIDDNSWRARWEISGPRKDVILNTVFHRSK